MNGKGRSQLWNWMAYFYDQFYRRFPPYLRLHREIFKILENSSPDLGYILDVGCGTGILSAELARRGYAVIGMDRSLAMLNRAWEKKKKENLKNLILLEGDLNGKINLPELAIQRIIFIHSLYLTDRPQETLKNMSLFLPPGKEIIMCNPSRRITIPELLAGGRSFLLEALRREGIQPILGLFGVGLAMGMLNIVIQRRKNNFYQCWGKREIEDLLGQCNFRLKMLKKCCLADSHLLLCAIKEC
jgi:ubiquinone/menaquinone biosynthesis C-methylase UbiE